MSSAPIQKVPSLKPPPCLKWHKFPQDVPANYDRTRQYLVRHVCNTIDGPAYLYAVDYWAGSAWYSISYVVAWAEIPAPT